MTFIRKYLFRPNKVQTSKSKFPVLLVIMLTITTFLLSMTMLHSNNEAVAQKQTQRSPSLPDIVTIQNNTSMSISAPNAPANKQNVPYQIVVALLLREDGKILGFLNQQYPYLCHNICRSFTTK